MSHSPLFGKLLRILRFGSAGHEAGISGREAKARMEESEHRARQLISRRSILGGLAVVTAGAAVGVTRLVRADVKNAPRVAVIGAGLAGLSCADRLQKFGIIPTIYESNDRVGGRTHTERDVFPGQVAEFGGEMIDTGHQNMRNYAAELGFKLESYVKQPGSEAFYFNGVMYTEDQVIEEIGALTAKFKTDLNTLSGEPTFYSHKAADVALDSISLAQYLQRYTTTDSLAYKVIQQSYISEYGRELEEQSPLNFLKFYDFQRDNKFLPYGSSDERFHVKGGNDAIAHAIAARFPGSIITGARLTKIRKTTGGKFALTFNGGGTEEIYDFVVIAVSFAVLRRIELDPSLGLSADKLRAINELGYGYNCKTMIAFSSSPWGAAGYNGSADTDLPNVQQTWETNFTSGDDVGRWILTDYAGGTRGQRLQTNTPWAFAPAPAPAPGCDGCHVGAPQNRIINPTTLGYQADAFLTDLDKVWPGAKAAAIRDYGILREQFGHWYTNPHTRGSYTCYLTGQFTGIAGLEAEPCGRLLFAGEHTDSFYWWQGYMEGAVRSGFARADDIIEASKKWAA